MEWRRAAIKPVCYWMSRPGGAEPLPRKDCGTCKLSVVSRLPEDCWRSGNSRRRLCAWASRFIPQRKLHPVPESQLVVDHAQIILDHMLGCADLVGHVTILQALRH